MNRLAVALLFVAAPAFAADPFEGLDAEIAKALKSHGVPGVGVAVVRDGKVILARGFGVKEIGKPEPVTEKTLFAIGSVTKSFTVAMVAMLVDEKKLDWDDSLRLHLPNFRMSDRFYSDEVTLRDCLNHRVGLPRNELLWYGSPFDREEVLRRVRLLKPTAKIRTKFIYNNILYMAVGQAAGKGAGKSWDDFVQERIFQPLGMKTANTSITMFAKDGDIATPHAKAKGKPTPIPWLNVDNIGPAGSINASAADMAEYVKFQLAKGKVGDKRLIERSTFAVMHTPQIILPGASDAILNPDAKLKAYGLGWFVSDYRGFTLVEHGGNIDGMTASVMLLPEKKLGVVVLANLTGSTLPPALGYEIFDRVLGHESRNLLETTSVIAKFGEAGVQFAAEPDASTRVKGTKPSFELKKYAGKFEDEIFPPLTVKFKDDELKLAFNSLEYDLSHWHYDTFVGTDPKGVRPKLLFTFDQTTDAKVAAIRFMAITGDEARYKKVK